MEMAFPNDNQKMCVEKRAISKMTDKIAEMVKEAYTHTKQFMCDDVEKHKTNNK